MSLLKESSKFIVAGIVSNLAIYAGYLLLTSMGIQFKIAMTVMFCIGVLLSFVLNKNWTFKYKGRIKQTATKFSIIYLFAYLLNLGILNVFVDQLGLPHEPTQLMAMGLIAVFLFTTQKLFIFVK